MSGHCCSLQRLGFSLRRLLFVFFKTAFGLFKKKNIYLYLAVLGLRCCAGFSLVAVRRLLVAVASLVEYGLYSMRASAIEAHGLRSCSSWALEPRAQQLWPVSLVTLWRVDSFWNRDQTHVPCIGRCTPIPSATREVLH